MDIVENNGYYKPIGAVGWSWSDIHSKAFNRWGINDQINKRYISRISIDCPGNAHIYEQIKNNKKLSAILVKFWLNDLGIKSYHKDIIIWFIPSEEYADVYNKLTTIFKDVEHI